MPGPVWLIYRRLQQAHLVLLITLCLCVACSRSQPGASEAGRRRINEVRLLTEDLAKPRVFYVLQTGPLITAGRDTFINDLINLSGGHSISAEETAAYPQFSRESVVARAPEVIIAPESHGSEMV